MKSIAERFENKFEMIPECGCWIWTGYTGKNRYGNFLVNGKTLKAHRVSWEIHNGPIPEGMCVCHRCDTPSCVNPHHLFLGTHSDNMMDASKKGHRNGSCGKTRGENQPTSKLTWEIVRNIRTSSIGVMSLARQYGVSHSLISMIRHNKIWKGDKT